MTAATSSPYCPMESKPDNDTAKQLAKQHKLDPKQSCLVFGNGYRICTRQFDLNRVMDALADDSKCAAAVQYFEGCDFSKIAMGAGAAKIYSDPNAGGNSERSEAMSFEIMNRCFGAALWKTEMNIEYEWSISKRTDYSCHIYGRKIGVSVTRAINFKAGKVAPFGEEEARALLTKKLSGVKMSSRDVIETDAWEKQMLHVWTLDAAAADALVSEWNKLDKDIKGNTVVLVTVAPGADWVFFNR